MIRGPILALDLGTAMGWCCGTPDRPPVLGTVKLAPKGGHGERGCALVDFLSDNMAVFDPWIIAYEAPLVSSDQRSQASGLLSLGLVMAVKMFCYRKSIICRAGNVQQARKAVLGSARKKKIDAWDACCRAGLKPDTENASDAWLLWRFAILLKGDVGPVDTVGIGLPAAPPF